jgi:hypothetical protein
MKQVYSYRELAHLIEEGKTVARTSTLSAPMISMIVLRYGK